jgi:DNA-binding NarL/FixJ family response regulator
VPTPPRRPAPQAASVRRPQLRSGVLAEPVTVAVLAGDPITGQGAAAFLSSCAGVKVLASDRQHEAEVVLILVSWVTEETLEWMQQAAGRARREVRFVLVGDGVREQHVLRAITCGLVSVIPRQEADFDRILRAIDAVREDRLEMPDVALGWLVNQVRAIQQDVLEPMGVTAAGLETREADVLRLLADGLGTPEIAVRLNYSERTVKNIIHGVLTRWQLRNRAHAVAFALRTGAI